LKHSGPAALRYPKTTLEKVERGAAPVELGQAEIYEWGPDGALIAYGTLFPVCVKAAEKLRKEEGLELAVINARFAKPIDTDLLLRLAREHEVLITIEEGAIGGFGAQALQTLAENGVLDGGLRVRSMILPDIFIDQDSPAAMYAQAGLDSKGIVAKAFEALGQNLRGEAVKLGRA